VSSPESTGSSQDDAAQRPVDGFAEHLAEVSGAPVDEPLLLRALTHRSYAYENGGLPNNERLEFLGDSVLGLVVTDTLYAAHPDLPEGQLAKLRAAVVNMRALAEVARTLGLGDHLLLGRGEESTGGRDKASILADTMEAVIGTVYLSAGMPAAAALVHHLLDPLMAQSATMGAGLDWKTSLQELAAASSAGVPEYRVDEEGPDHQKTFHAQAVVGEQVLGSGSGRSKKEAEQRAAEVAWRALTAAAAAADGDGLVAHAQAHAQGHPAPALAAVENEAEDEADAADLPAGSPS
jgi:ribonuclease-3